MEFVFNPFTNKLDVVDSAVAFSATNVQVFTSSGTYTPSPGMSFCVVELLGAGGGGAGSTEAGAQGEAGAGGGAGEYAKAIFDAAAIGASKAITIGAAGAGGAAGLDGVDGGFSELIGLMTCNGGDGGTNTGLTLGGVVAGAAGGSGGTTTGNIGDEVRFAGAYSQIGFVSGGNVFGGQGANSMYGSGGFAGVETDGGDASGYGSGGGGSSSASGGSNAAGGDGGPGVCIILEFIQ